ncbi:amylo-alpha-1,6-glucosidase [Thermodesulfitimonas autotrophica]|uniref:amylo-alpha-1,6-glucosidase n=1 Tax=Thermodesulfitimonas autotrophica TaxID=1894989 RepID=UPI002FE41518
MVHFGLEAWRTFERGCEREWFVTNGLGGFAAGTIIGANTRRYHGLLIAALNPPVRRFLLLAKLDERLEAGGVFYNLATNYTAGGVTESGFVHLVRARFCPFPEFFYCCGHIQLRKLIFMPHGQNATVILYRVTNAGPLARLILTPLINYRDYHGNSYRGQISFHQEPIADGVRISGPEGLPPLLLRISNGEFSAAPNWFYGMRYPEEEARGLNPWEDHYQPGRFTVELPAGSEKVFAVVAATGLGPRPEEAEALLAAERERLAAVEQAAGFADSFARALVRAADAFLVQRASGAATIIAGYPWFTDWGRDTMIALPGITLLTGRFQAAREILELFGAYVREGLLPNYFPDDGGEPLYNTVDAALWYCQAVYKYFQYTQDEDFVVKIALPAMREIVTRYAGGTRYGIVMADDGLLKAGNPDIQLTWMDAKVGDWVVTPRHGKAVEINALWYNAACILEEFHARFKLPNPLPGLAAKIREGFRAFWHPAGYLYDVLREEEKEAKIRPNQIFAVSLPFSPLSQDEAEAVVRRVEAELYTPYGLRSLSARDPDYKGHYAGDQRQRDAAYHQGTVWSWLIGPFVTAYRKVHCYSPDSQERARVYLSPFQDHLADHGIGSVSEIFDGDWPHRPRGCFAQAWSVAEVLRAYVEEVLEKRAGRG